MALYMVGLIAALGATTATVPARSASPAPAATAQQPPSVARAQFLDMVRAEYAGMDMNKDGKVNKVELQQYRTTKIVALRQQRNRQVFAALDVDKNGSVSPQEFAKLVGPLPKVNVDPLMARVDKNADQQITLAEYYAGGQADFDRLDVDKDAILSPAEARAGQKQPPK